MKHPNTFSISVSALSWKKRSNNCRNKEQVCIGMKIREDMKENNLIFEIENIHRFFIMEKGI